jgi:hypothetical protein
MTDQLAPPSPPPPPTMPISPADAATRINELKADKAFVDRYLAGGLVEKREMTALHEMILSKSDNPDVDKAIAGIRDDGVIQRSEHMQMIGVAGMLRELGIRDEIIRETLTGKEVTQAEHDAVARLKADRMSDHAWTKEYLNGSNSHKREMMLISIALSSPVRKEQAA